jgi:hypothetical protein
MIYKFHKVIQIIFLSSSHSLRHSFHPLCEVIVPLGNRSIDQKSLPAGYHFSDIIHQRITIWSFIRGLFCRMIILRRSNGYFDLVPPVPPFFRSPFRPGDHLGSFFYGNNFAMRSFFTVITPPQDHLHVIWWQILKYCNLQVSLSCN